MRPLNLETFCTEVINTKKGILIWLNPRGRYSRKKLL